MAAGYHRRMRTFLTPLLTAALLAVAGCASPPASRAPTAAQAPAPTVAPVLLVSIDGLRPDDLPRLPTLQHLADTGVRAQWMNPSFPSLTFPNHYTLVTGLRPDHHGIVHNTMRDPQLGRFSMDNRQAVGDGRWWDGGEPIWVTAHKAGLRTATMFWPGSEAVIHGVRPDEWHAFDAKVTPDARVDRVLGWFDLPPAQRPALMTLYFDQVDHAEHDGGPESPPVLAALAEVDAALARLVDGLRRRGMLDATNLVVVSDHGMARVPDGQVVTVDAMVPADIAEVDTAGQVVGVRPLPGHEAEAEARLLGRHPHYECWRKQELPERWHYGTHPRIPPIVCQMDEGWDALYAGWKAKRRPGDRGSHGFDPALPSMRATFVAHGPAFRAGTVLQPFDNVDVYPLLADLLGIAPAANDGNLAPLRPALRDPR
ncbi:putative AlkP superfamily pyrophosphatase or phosphodiesterase [Thermomonas haemolytica]|uniref:Putative AlkP superfamily pyrophosphatase or phosphodiesterase n=2 Tax=Thermomonas haemolytica TaxID=141949 RepID=A0A4R3N3Q2_9GAMM|nr:putative AlkP superfamily pyrophosphatase or phosphodiesterase [Thermomonas haemolytica]